MAWFTSEGFSKIASTETVKCPKCGTMGSVMSSNCSNCSYVLSYEKSAGAMYFGEAAILKTLGHSPKSLKVAKAYRDLGSSYRKKLLTDIPGTEGKYLLKNPRHREIATHFFVPHPERLQLALPLASVHGTLAEVAKRQMTGVEDVIKEVKKVKSAKKRKRLLNNLSNVLSIVGGGAAGVGLAKTASVEYRGKTFPGYGKPIASDRKNKKKMVLVKRGDKVKLVHFGQKGYQDFTQHKDKKRQKNYLTRSAGIKNKSGQLTKNDPFSPNYWARRELW